MIIEKINLVNFRSHERYELECEEATSLILGPNGCGKTSVLEGVYEATRGKSFRAVDREIVKRGAEYYRVELLYSDGEKVVVAYDVAMGKKTFLVGDRKWARLPKKYRYPVVLFLPDDLHLVGSSPSRKRDYFDRLLVELDEEYAKALSGYNRALRQRNELLKGEFVRPEMVFSWNVLLARYGCEIRDKRVKFVYSLNECFTDTYRSIANNRDIVGLSYDWASDSGHTRGRVDASQGAFGKLTVQNQSTNLESPTLMQKIDNGHYLSILEDGFERDRVMGYTSYGAHRDNFSFKFNGVEADGSASRGETRSMVIAMKFIEAEMILGQTGRKPVVLLDDVFSELDAKRQECLVKNFKDNQILLTSVEKVGI